jgi:hypothetical protein
MRIGCGISIKIKVSVIMGYWWYWFHAKPEIPDFIPSDGEAGAGPLSFK